MHSATHCSPLPEPDAFLAARDARQLDDVEAAGDGAVGRAIRFREPRPSSLVARELLETRILTCAAPTEGAVILRCSAAGG